MYKSAIKLVFLLGVVAFTAASYSGAYFSDTVTLRGNSFTAGAWDTTENKIIINEVYYNVGNRTFESTSNAESEGKNEWIELYNPGSEAVNIKGYEIQTTIQSFTVNANVSVPALGYALLSHDANTWHFWSVPTGDKIVTINLGGSPDDWLANSGDTVQLMNTDGNPVDEVTYGSGGVNINGLLVGQSIQRIETAHDTDTPSDWKINPSPNPGI
jgi:hypothetical protein